MINLVEESQPENLLEEEKDPFPTDTQFLLLSNGSPTYPTFKRRRKTAT
jgi:hypothetical protein